MSSMNTMMIFGLATTLDTGLKRAINNKTTTCKIFMLGINLVTIFSFVICPQHIAMIVDNQQLKD